MQACGASSVGCGLCMGCGPRGRGAGIAPSHRLCRRRRNKHVYAARRGALLVCYYQQLEVRYHTSTP